MNKAEQEKQADGLRNSTLAGMTLQAIFQSGEEEQQ
jgi:hypothetical protein